MSEDIKTRLLAERVIDEANYGKVEIEGVGTVTVRGFTRAEMMIMEKRFPGQKDLAGQERLTLAWCMIDPVMTEDEVAQWQKVSPAMEINRVSMEINRLSGITRGADKEQYKSIRE